MTETKDLNVIVGGRIITRINPLMLDKQNCWDKLEDIKHLHEVKYLLMVEMDSSNSSGMGSDVLKTYAKLITEVEFKLQDAWGFPRNNDYHRFWDLPGCKCPKMDNDDRWPTGYYVINGDCPIHGNE